MKEMEKVTQEQIDTLAKKLEKLDALEYGSLGRLRRNLNTNPDVKKILRGAKKKAISPQDTTYLKRGSIKFERYPWSELFSFVDKEADKLLDELETKSQATEETKEEKNYETIEYHSPLRKTEIINNINEFSAYLKAPRIFNSIDTYEWINQFLSKKDYLEAIDAVIKNEVIDSNAYLLLASAVHWLYYEKDSSLNYLNKKVLNLMKVSEHNLGLESYYANTSLEKVLIWMESAQEGKNSYQVYEKYFVDTYRKRPKDNNFSRMFQDEEQLLWYSCFHQDIQKAQFHFHNMQGIYQKELKSQKKITLQRNEVISKARLAYDRSDMELSLEYNRITLQAENVISRGCIEDAKAVLKDLDSLLLKLRLTPIDKATLDYKRSIMFTGLKLQKFTKTPLSKPIQNYLIRYIPYLSSNGSMITDKDFKPLLKI